MTGPEINPPSPPAAQVRDPARLDKWLWHARFLKSRSLATKLCKSGKLRINGTPTDKAHHPLKVGDVLTFPLGPHIRIREVWAIAIRRGPAPEARALYQDLAPPPARAKRGPAPLPDDGARPRGAGRPTKSDRRAIDRLQKGDTQG